MERNLHDCLGVSKNLYTDPRLVPGGGASEMEISARINQEANKYEGIEQLPFRAGKLLIIQLVMHWRSFLKLWPLIVEWMLLELLLNLEQSTLRLVMLHSVLTEIIKKLMICHCKMFGSQLLSKAKQLKLLLKRVAYF